MGQKVVVISGRLPMYDGMPITGAGQVIELTYQRNDDLLLKHRYVRPIEDREEVWSCDQCPLEFLGDITSGPAASHLRIAHGPNAGRPAAANADPDGSGEFPLETEGAPPPTKVGGSGDTVALR